MLRSISITLVLLISTIHYACFAEIDKPQPSNPEVYRQFQEMFEKINKEYVEVPDKQKMIDAAVEGMVTSLDPHCNYFTDDDLQDFVNQTKGEFGGIGVEIVYDKGAIKVISPIDDLPADRAGIKAGDYIVKVNDELVSNLGFNKSVRDMRGDPGSKVKLTVVNDQETKPRELELTRQIVKFKAVKSRLFDEIAYVRVVTFNKNTIAELKKAFQELNDQAKNKILGIVLDLRNNPGGLLDQGVAVSEYFIDSGTIVFTKGRLPTSNTIFASSKFSSKAPKVPMVVLINSGSASASEIVAGALQDHQRALILGTKSFGKGSVQTFVPLNNRSGVSITTALYYTPNGRSIQGEGIEPDILVEPAKVEYPVNDSIFKNYSESSLKGALKNGNTKKDQPKADQTKKDQLETKTSNEETKTKKEDGLNNSEKPTLAKETEIKSPVADDLYQKDFQFARAFDLVKALIIVNKEKL